MDLKDRINKSMISNGINQAELCRKTGMGSSKVSQILQGKTTDPRLSTVLKIADALDVSLDYLAGRKQTPEIRLSTDEKQLVSNYRDSTPDRKRTLQQTAHDSAVMSKDMEECEISAHKSKAV